MKPTTRHSIIDAHMHLPVDFKNPEEKKNAATARQKRNQNRRGRGCWAAPSLLSRKGSRGATGPAAAGFPGRKDRGRG